MEEQGEPTAGPVGSFESVHAYENVPESPVHDAPSEHAPQQDVNPMMQQFMEMMQRTAQAQSSRSQKSNIDKNYERVRNQGAKVFTGTTDPTIAEEWLRSTERILDRIECTPKQRLKYAVSLLEKDALDWWETVPKSKDTTYFNLCSRVHSILSKILSVLLSHSSATAGSVVPVNTLAPFFLTFS